MQNDEIKFIAHPSKDPKKPHQTVLEHLTEVSEISRKLGAKISAENEASLIGLLHDFGKYSASFQNYMGLIIVSNDDSMNPDLDEDHKALKGKIDHSTAGAQWIMNAVMQSLKDIEPRTQEEKQFAFGFAQILAICIASHHSGLIDNLPSETSKGFITRLKKDHDETHLPECERKADNDVIEKAKLLLSTEIIKRGIESLKAISANESGAQHPIPKAFNQGFYTRMLFSAS